jgi:hypothetical protein
VLTAVPPTKIREEDGFRAIRMTQGGAKWFRRSTRRWRGKFGNGEVGKVDCSDEFYSVVAMANRAKRIRRRL